jgi:hypothetical protein
VDLWGRRGVDGV